MLCDSRIGPDTVSIHQRDQFDLAERQWCGGSTLLHDKRLWFDATTNLHRRELPLSRSPSFPRLVDCKPILFQYHESSSVELFRPNSDRRLCLTANRIARTTRQVVLDHKNVHLSLRWIGNRAWIDGFAGSDRRMGLVVVLSRSGSLKVIPRRQPLRIGRKLGILGSGQLLNQRLMIEFGSELFRLGSRIGNVPLLVQILCSRHERFTANPQIPRSSLL